MSHSPQTELLLKACSDIARGAEIGKKKVAAAALKSMVELLATGPNARANAAMLRDNRLRTLRDGSDAKPPKPLTWEDVLSRVLFFLSLGKLVKSDVEKLRVLVGAAVGAGTGALSSKAELKVFCYMCVELGDVVRTPIKADKSSAHPECIGVLLQLTSSRPHVLARLTPTRQGQLLESCMRWIIGEDPDAEQPAGAPTASGFDDLSGGASGGGSAAASGPKGLHPTVAALPQLMVQYAQLLHQLVVAWAADMPVLQHNGSADEGGVRCTAPSAQPPPLLSLPARSVDAPPPPSPLTACRR
jgi:hypothetical protein